MPHKGESVHLFSQLLLPRILIFRQGSPSHPSSLPLCLSLSLIFPFAFRRASQGTFQPRSSQTFCLSHKPVSSGKAKASDSETNANSSSSNSHAAFAGQGKHKCRCRWWRCCRCPARRGGGTRAGLRPHATPAGRETGREAAPRCPRGGPVPDFCFVFCALG